MSSSTSKRKYVKKARPAAPASSTTEDEAQLVLLENQPAALQSPGSPAPLGQVAPLSPVRPRMDFPRGLRPEDCMTKPPANEAPQQKGKEKERVPIPEENGSSSEDEDTTGQGNIRCGEDATLDDYDPVLERRYLFWQGYVAGSFVALGGAILGGTFATYLVAKFI